MGLHRHPQVTQSARKDFHHHSGDWPVHCSTIFVNSSTRVGTLIVEVVERIKKEGNITLKEGGRIRMRLGSRRMCGSTGHHPIPCNRSQGVKGSIRRENGPLGDEDLAPQVILPTLEAAALLRRSLPIITEDVGGEALTMCILSELRGHLQVAAVPWPYLGRTATHPRLHHTPHGWPSSSIT
ncbi:60 kDa chaperonin [Ephemerocybe angulata]|uniref:60 kDa chaperonin n=1 Tax=Ephemerocybe angulata TaxID=980116 RepID=A0A8H6LWC4_9AGAR|nr:60 kDa chaperonin [Tulosesus angulatus]